MRGADVLVIDESPTILKLVQTVLARAGYLVATATSGEAGLAAAQREAPGAVLVNHELADLTWFDLCAAMSATPKLSSVPIVVMSPKGGETEARLPGMATRVDFITKPFSPDALLAIMQHCFGKPSEPRREPLLPAGPAATPANGSPAQTASLSGDLAVFSIADVLALLADQACTGALTITRGARRLEVYFCEGRIDFALAGGMDQEFLLGRFLVETGQISAAEIAAVIDARSRPGTRHRLLGEDLMARGLVTEDGLKKAVAAQTASLVYEGLRWSNGKFWFSAMRDLDLPERAQHAAVGLPVSRLLMEGFRRVDEWYLIEREIPDFGLVCVRDDARLAAFGTANLLREEHMVLEFINGKNSVKDIVGLSKMGSFDVTKMLYRLLRTHLVRRRQAPIVV